MTRLLKCLVELGGDINARDERTGNTPLIELVKNGNIIDNTEDNELFLAMIELGADVNARDKYGKTAFLYIMERKILTAYGIRMFKDTGADITVRSDSGDNVLASILFNNNAWDFFNRRISAINTLFDLGFSIQDMYPNWTIENFSKRILNSSMEKTAKESMALFFAMKLGPEKSAELLKIIEQNRVGAVEMIASLPRDTKGIKGLEEILLKTLVQTKGKKFLLDSNNKSIQERFVSTLLAVMETNPGLVIEFIKKCLSPKQFALWSNIKCDGAEKLTAKIVPLIKKNNNKKTSEEESPDIFF